MWSSAMCGPDGWETRGQVRFPSVDPPGGRGSKVPASSVHDDLKLRFGYHMTMHVTCVFPVTDPQSVVGKK